MALSKHRRNRQRTIDATAWILGAIIVVLATLDVMVWASLDNVPNPLSKIFADYAHASSISVRHAGR
jgi:hypothetical protein